MASCATTLQPDPPRADVLLQEPRLFQVFFLRPTHEHRPGHGKTLIGAHQSVVWGVGWLEACGFDGDTSPMISRRQRRCAQVSHLAAQQPGCPRTANGSRPAGLAPARLLLRPRLSRQNHSLARSAELPRQPHRLKSNPDGDSRPRVRQRQTWLHERTAGGPFSIHRPPSQCCANASLRFPRAFHRLPQPRRIALHPWSAPHPLNRPLPTPPLRLPSRTAPQAGPHRRLRRPTASFATLASLPFSSPAWWPWSPRRCRPWWWLGRCTT